VPGAAPAAVEADGVVEGILVERRIGGRGLERHLDRELVDFLGGGFDRIRQRHLRGFLDDRVRRLERQLLRRALVGEHALHRGLALPARGRRLPFEVPEQEDRERVGGDGDQQPRGPPDLFRHGVLEGLGAVPGMRDAVFHDPCLLVLGAWKGSNPIHGNEPGRGGFYSAMISFR